MLLCDGWAHVNAMQKHTNKVTNLSGERAGETIFMDTSGPNPEKAAGSGHCFQFVDIMTQKPW